MSDAPAGAGDEITVDEAIARFESLGLKGHDREVYLQLRRVRDEFAEDYSAAMTKARGKVHSLNLQLGGGNRVTPALRVRIVDMIRAGMDDGLALAMLDRVYLQSGMHDEFCELCEDVLRFEGEAKDRMMGSVLVECAIQQLVHHLSSGCGGANAHENLAERCIGLLERRARVLGICVPEHKEESNPLYRASTMSMDICARRHIEPPGEIDRLLRGYPALYEFLGLSAKKITQLARKRTDLAYRASIAIHIRKSTPSHMRPKPGPLDLLEHLLRAMEDRGLQLNDARYSPWKIGICDKKLAQCHFEMRLYLHFLRVDSNVKLGALIDNGKDADLKVRDLYVEAFAPHETTDTAYGHLLLGDAPRGG